jgi:hypothetical protein
MGPSILFLVFPLFLGSFVFFMIGRVFIITCEHVYLVSFSTTSGYPRLCRDIGTPMRFLLLSTFFFSSKALHPTVIDRCLVLSFIFFLSLWTLNQHLYGCILNCTLQQLIIQVQRMGWIRQPVNFRSNKKSPGVSGRARSTFCDEPELRHGRMDVVNL